MTQRLGIRKSLDELEKEAWAPKPSMLETPAVMTGLDADRKVVIKDTENRVSLNGIWQMVWDGDERERLDLSVPWKDSIPANVPCSVHTALYEAGIIPDPTVGLNDKTAREYSYKTWWLKKEFSREDGCRANQLYFEGICHYAKIWLNGHYLGEHKGMFGRPVFDAAPYLQRENTLIVKIENSPARPQPMSEYMDNDEGWHDGVVINCVYGWHYACIPSRGIWAPVGLEEKKPSCCSEKPLVSCGDTDEGIVDICMKFHGTGGKVTITGEIEGKNHKGKGGPFFTGS